MSSLNVQHILMTCGSWFLLSGHSCMMSCMRHCRCWSWDIASCSLFIVIHCCMLVVDCIALTPNYIPGISSYLFFLWFCLDSQFTMNRSGPGLYMILTQYWSILNRICLSIYDNVAMSFLSMETTGLWSVIIPISLAKQ